MNRIYQGRVSKVESIDGVNGQLTSLGLEVLWQHHALFQDAVNYYLVCLLALAGDSCQKQRELRDRLTTKPKDGNDESLDIWERFRRRGTWRRGLRDSVAQYLCPDREEASSQECFAAVLKGNEFIATEEGRKLLDRGLRQLLDKCTGASGCKQAAPVFLPRFCKPEYQGSYGADTITLDREYKAKQLPLVLHDPLVNVESAELDRFDVYSVALPNEKKPKFVGADALKKLRGMVGEWRERQPYNETDWTRLETKIAQLPANLELPGYAATSAKNEKKFRLFAMFFFRHVERSEFTLDLLRTTTPKPKDSERPPERLPTTETSGDPIRIARGKRGFVFRAFTSLPCWKSQDTGKPQWIQFDFAAFEEALKTLHQVDDKAKEREALRKEKQAQHDYQRKPPHKWKDGVSEEERRPPILAGDPRIARLEQLVDVDLRTEYEMSEGVEVKYGLHPRTIRGFRDVRKKWNEAASKGADKARLWELLTEYKIENAETIGSPTLFDALVEELNWIIWREPDAAILEQWRKAADLPESAEFCGDPLQALTDERELLADIERLKDPIRLTPADPEHSRRQFYFSDVTDLTKKGRFRHDRNYLETAIAQRVDSKWVPRWVRIHFGAPRLFRDQLKSESGHESVWQQAMMAALGLKAGLIKKGRGKLRPASFADCAAVALMPEIAASGEQRILLNFPLTLEDDSIAKQLGKAERWDANQFGPNFKNSSWLRWPSTPAANAKSSPWWERGEAFQVLSVDLGQRDAAAFALLQVTPGKAPKPQSRKLGETGNTIWWGTVRATGMLRLPGEDARIFRKGSRELEEELSGERGRNLAAGEWQEAREICAALGLEPDKVLGADDRRYSFPELNGQLLYALRRAQARLARLQSWSCVAYEESDEQKQAGFEKRRARIKEQIIEAISARAVEEKTDQKDRGQELSERSKWLCDVQPLVEKNFWDGIAERIAREVQMEREVIKRELLRIADRLQPLRGRRWEWVSRPNDSKNYFLRQTERGTDNRKKLLAGQRGLSMKRLGQLDSFRDRCQSLNRALRQEPGIPAKLGRSKRGIELPDPCPELLDRLDALKEQRVNQTAHLILAQALGVRLRPHSSNAKEREKNDIHGEYERIPGREPVDFIVIENLKYYEMSQSHARSENARLMKWCRRHLRDKLIQLCEPYGLRVLEEWPADTSKFCSLTGVAGFRAVELTPDDAQEFRWKKHLDRVADPERSRKLSKDERKESERVKALFDALQKFNADLLAIRGTRPKWRTLLAPSFGGPIFIPMSGKPFQADINAAINLGLRALASPECQEIHLRLRSERKDEKFFVRAQNLREKARWNKEQCEITPLSRKYFETLLTESRPYFYKDTGTVAEFDRAEICGQRGFASSRGIWGTIKRNEWLRVGTLNNDRLEKAGLSRTLEDEDKIPGI